MGSAGVRPVRLHQTAVIHRREQDQVRLGPDVFEPQLIEVQVETDGEGDTPDVALEDRRLASAEDARLRRLLDDHVVLVVDAHDSPLAILQRAGVAPGPVVHLPRGRVDDIAVVLSGNASEEITNLVLAHAVIRQAFVQWKPGGAVARLRHQDQIGTIRQDL